jgi:hypothetical protein
MKKQLFTLALLTLGYVASSHSMGVAVLAHMNKINETMPAGTTQMVRGVDAHVVKETPRIPGQSVLRIEEVISGPNKGKWIITTENPGTASIVIKKKLSGYTNKFHSAEHDITVTRAKNKKGKYITDEDGLVVESIESVVSDKGIVVDEIEMDSEARISHIEMRDDVMNDVE